MKVIEILKKYKLTTKKNFGQNFLTDENILDKIVSVSGNIENKNIIEIGPGPGGLTYSILKHNPKKLLSIEIDKNYFEILKTEFANYKNFEVINKDALKVNEIDYFKIDTQKIKLIANLPYNVGTALLIKWLKNLKEFEDFTLLLQKEVVNRIVAPPNTKDYGRLSVLVQALCDAKSIFDIKPTFFLPPPKVMSSVIYIKPKNNFFDINIERLSKITFILFNQRRKIIKKSIENLIKNKSLSEKSIENINLNKRAEEITVEEYIELSKKFN